MIRKLVLISLAAFAAFLVTMVPVQQASAAPQPKSVCEKIGLHCCQTPPGSPNWEVCDAIRPEKIDRKNK